MPMFAVLAVVPRTAAVDPGTAFCPSALTEETVELEPPAVTVDDALVWSVPEWATWERAGYKPDGAPMPPST
jgi:hypothetical protein